MQTIAHKIGLEINLTNVYNVFEGKRFQ